MNDARPPLPQKRAGLFEATVQKLFTRTANVIDIVEAGPAYRIVTLRGDALKNVAWTPGDKIQVQLGGWVQRTYTPLEWDAIHGRTRILVYLHGEAPGTQWARALRRGDDCVLFGPRKSISLGSTRAPAIVCGDETSLGLAAALSAHGAAPVVHALIEVGNVAETLPVLAQLGLINAHLCERRASDGHVAELESQLSALLMQDASTDIVLTGKAATIQHLTRFLRQTGMGAGRRHSKAYWADGKTGLD